MAIVQQPIGVIKRARLIDLIAQLRDLDELREQVRRAEMLAHASSQPMTRQRRGRLHARPTPVSAIAKMSRPPRSG
jgi:hypothetical protein